MAKIVINPKPSFQQRLRRFSVYINGTKAGEVVKGSPEEFVVPAGIHSIQCKMNWYSSNSYEVSLNENDVKLLQVQSNMPYFWLFYTLFIGSLLAPMAMKWLGVEKPASFETIRAVLLVVVVLYFLFFTFIKRKTYLRVSEDSNNIFNS